MTVGEWFSVGTAVRSLRMALRGDIGEGEAVVERCQMCAERIEEHHGHVVDLDSRRLLCTCRPCALLFDTDASAGHYRTIPQRYLAFPEFVLDRVQWEALQIPVGLAFFFHNSRLGRTVACYPSPAGATESELPIEAWENILAANPRLRTAMPDVEAVLVADAGAENLAPPSEDGGFACFLVPIDSCYELVGHLRMSWRGFDGGQEARERLEGFFTELRGKCRPVEVCEAR
ncbi:DUF5947 family protein [Sciscionella marina]|uniref:DUF5947 family protein n=1 Tax=Sciscionella marina TaxID=508770 RepID=UPI00037053D1|nr:DUF5947 family protein [Sciscionella marina]